MNSRALLTTASRLMVPKFHCRNGARMMSSHYVEEYKPPKLDDMPVPQGSWQKDYDSKQKGYNIQLVGGIAFFLFTIGFIYKSEKIFFNFYPPELPEEMMGTNEKK